MSRSVKKHLAFPLYPGITALDVVGPLTVLRNLAIGTSYRSITVAHRIAEVPTDTRLTLLPSASFAQVPHPFALVVPGGGAAIRTAMGDPTLLAYVRSAAATAEVVAATGNGALILAAAGLLDGRPAAAHWAYADLLESSGARYVPDRWVEDGRFLTAAGGTAGMDMMLALLARLKDESGARLAQLFMEYDPEPPFGPPDMALADAALGARLRGSGPLDRAEQSR